MRPATRSAALLAAVPALLLASPLRAQPPGQGGAGDPADAFVGRWQAVHKTEHGALLSENLFDYEFFRDGEVLKFRDRGRLPMTVEAPAVSIASDGAARAQWKVVLPRPLSIEARVVDDGRALQATISGLGITGRGHLPLRLERAPAALRAYFAPRLAPGGGRQHTYTYARPAVIEGSLPSAAAASVRVDRVPLEAMVREILAEEDRTDARHTEGVLVMRHGKLVFEEYFWGYRRELAHAIASATKSVASILVGAAVDAGKLNIDSLVADHYPAYRGRRWQREGYPIRVRDLLSMTAGLEWTDRSAADQYTQRLLASDDPVGFVFDLARAEPPGARYNYNNGLPVLLGPILSQATGETVDAFADRVLFAPLGIRNYAWAALRDDKPLLTGGMRMPARDMAKLGQLMLDGGVWNGKRVVSRDWVALATARQTPQGQYPYGYFWHLSDPGQPWRGEPPSYLGPIDRYRAFMALGQGGQAIVVLPEADVVIVVVSSNWVPGMSEAFPTRLINKYIIPAIG